MTHLDQPLDKINFFAYISQSISTLPFSPGGSMRLHSTIPDIIRNVIDNHPATKKLGPVYLLVWLPDGKRVEGYDEGLIETGIEGVTARIRASPHTANAKDFGGLFKLLAAKERAAGNYDQAKLTDAVQEATEKQDGRNAWRDDQEALGLPDPNGSTQLIVVAWGGRSGFAASIHFLEEIRKAYPRALNISAACDCNPQEKSATWREKNVSSGDATVNLGVTTYECNGAETMREIIDVILDHERHLRA